MPKLTQRVENEPLISQSAAARAIGEDRGNLNRYIKAGKIRSHGGKVRVSEVAADWAANVDTSRSKRQSGLIDGVVVQRPGTTPRNDADAQAGPVQSPVMALYTDARSRKEDALARLRQLEFEREAGKLVAVEDVARQVEREYAVVRERLLAIPGKLAAKLVDQDRSTIEAALLDEISEALNELHDPDGDNPSVG